MLQIKVDNPSELPDAGVRENLMEPYVKCASALASCLPPSPALLLSPADAPLFPACL